MKRRQPFLPGVHARPEGSGADFLRGFVAAGTLGAIQERGGQARLDRRTLRLALQGGSALAAGSAAARAWQEGRTGQALLSAALGTGAVLALEHLLQEPIAKEKTHGQEEA